MSTQSHPNDHPFVATGQWLAALDRCALAQHAGAAAARHGSLVFAQVQAIETRAARSLCPMRLRRQLLAWFR
mgnify:CR=1 FL=1